MQKFHIISSPLDSAAIVTHQLRHFSLYKELNCFRWVAVEAETRFDACKIAFSSQILLEFKPHVYFYYCIDGDTSVTPLYFTPEEAEWIEANCI